MKCDDFLPNLETPGAFGRLRARLHALHCGRCAAVRRQFVAARRDWARPAPLTPAVRETWLQAATTASPAMRRRSTRTQVRALAVAGAVVLVVTAVWTADRWTNRRADREVAAQQRPDAVIADIAAAADQPRVALDEYERGLDRVAAELAELEGLAELIDARRGVDRLSAAYRPLSASTQN